MRILCLSRAPLNYYAGIPAVCKSIYKNNHEHDVTILSPSLDPFCKHLVRKKNTYYTEYVYPSFFIYKTLALSLRYCFFLFRNIHRFDVVHYQHPDPFSALILIFCFFIRRLPPLVVTWHADIYRTFLFFSPFLLFIDFFLFLIARSIVFPTPFHYRSSLSRLYLPVSKLDFISLPLTIATSSTRSNICTNPEFPRKINLLSVGRLVSYKGYKYALLAMSLLDPEIYSYYCWHRSLLRSTFIINLISQPF